MKKTDFKERLLMEYTTLVEKMEDLRIFLDEYNDTSKEMTEEQNAYLQLMGKQMEGMIQYRSALYERIMMIMDGVIK
jgi:hypothetical protein